MPRQLGRASKQGEAATDGTGSVVAPDREKGHVGSALNVCVLWFLKIDLDTVDTFHLLCATVVTPFDYKRRVEA